MYNNLKEQELEQKDQEQESRIVFKL